MKRQARNFLKVNLFNKILSKIFMEFFRKFDGPLKMVDFQYCFLSEFCSFLTLCPFTRKIDIF